MCAGPRPNQPSHPSVSGSGPRITLLRFSGPGQLWAQRSVPAPQTVYEPRAGRAATSSRASADRALRPRRDPAAAVSRPAVAWPADSQMSIFPNRRARSASRGPDVSLRDSAAAAAAGFPRAGARLGRLGRALECDAAPSPRGVAGAAGCPGRRQVSRGRGEGRPKCGGCGAIISPQGGGRKPSRVREAWRRGGAACGWVSVRRTWVCGCAYH